MVATRILVATAVSFVLFSAEALIHFSIGKGKFVLPSPAEIGKILGTVFLFSALSAGISNYINHYLLPPPKKLGKRELYKQEKNI